MTPIIAHHSAPNPAESRLSEISQGLQAWAVTQALPFWATWGRDAKAGHFHETLMPDGSPDLGANQRIRVQARQIYVYAHAFHLGWHDEGANLSLQAFDRLMQIGRSPGQQGFHHLLTAAHQPLDTRRDSYDHAFMVLAFAWCWRVTGEARVRTALEETLAFIDMKLSLPDGSLREDDQETLPRRQNPHMHMFEAMLAVHETGARDDGLQRADRMLDVVLRHCLDARTGLLGEFFDEDFRLVSGTEGQIVEPGHMAEWVWLLRRRASMGPLALPGTDLDSLCARLLANATATAEPGTGFLIDEADRAGRAIKRTRRMWPQTELAKAHLAQCEAGVPGAGDKAAEILTRLFADYVEPAPHGAWLDQFGPEGQLISQRLPASTFYHVFVTCAEARRVAAWTA